MASHHSVRTMLELSDGARVVLLDCDSESAPRFENLSCYNSDGTLRWIAGLPQTHDAFVSVALDADLVRANSWRGYLVWLDTKTGALVRSEFVK